MYGDLEITQERIYDALDAMAKKLRDSSEPVEYRYLERLVKDRDELLALAHFNIGIPVLALAERTHIAWPQVYDIVDRVRDEKREEARRQAAQASPFGAFMMPAQPVPVPKSEDEAPATEELPDELDKDGGES